MFIGRISGSLESKGKLANQVWKFCINEEKLEPWSKSYVRNVLET